MTSEPTSHWDTLFSDIGAEPPAPPPPPPPRPATPVVKKERAAAPKPAKPASNWGAIVEDLGVQVDPALLAAPSPAKASETTAEPPAINLLAKDKLPRAGR